MKTKRKGYTLLELIVVMLVIAILVLVAFFGAKRYTDKAKMTRVQNDFHSFEMAATQMLLEHLEYIQLNSTDTNFTTKRIADLNRYLPSDMQAQTPTSPTLSKSDPWVQPYRLVFLTDNTTSSFFRIYLISNGPNIQTPSGNTKIDKDDLLMVIELKDAEVKSAIHGFSSDNIADTVITTIRP